VSEQKAEGDIVTNNHVVSGEQSIEVVLYDGSTEQAQFSVPLQNYHRVLSVPLSIIEDVCGAGSAPEPAYTA
jgi:hypothetical protein